MRLIDLHVDWLLQYAAESVVFDPSLYEGVEKQQSQAGGYLQTCRAAILSCYRDAAEWKNRNDPWAALDELITRLEAEFSGRLLIGIADFDRWQDDREGLAWGMIGVEGFDWLIRSSSDLEQLPRLFDRGVRLFQPVYGADNQLAGSSVDGDDRGLTELGREFLAKLETLGEAERGPRPILDLAHLNQRATSDVLTWFEEDPARSRSVLLVYSHGTPAHAGFHKARAISIENLVRLRSQGGHIGVGISPPFFQDSQQIKAVLEMVASIPFGGKAGWEGIAIGTDFLGVEETLTGLGDAEQVVAWIQDNFERPIAKDLIQDNALGLIARAIGAR